MNTTEIEEYRTWLADRPHWLLGYLLATEISNQRVLQESMPFPWPWKRKQIAFLEDEILRYEARISVIDEMMGPVK